MINLREISLVTIIFSYLFVGDYYYYKFPLFVLIWLIAILYRAVFNIDFSIKELLSQIIIFFVFSPLLFRGAYFGNQYEISIIYALLFVNIFPLFLVVLSNFKYQRYFMSISIAFLFLTIIMYILDIRSLVFGPNIFYRIVGFSYMTFFIISIKYKNVKRLNLVIAYAATLTTALATQSRGALLLSVVLGVITTIFLLKDSKHKYLFVSLFLSSLYLMFINIDSLSAFFGRSAYFDVNNASEAARLDFFSYTIDYYQNISFNSFLFGLGYPNKYFYLPGEYPHNLFLEIFLSFGALYFIAYILTIFISLFIYRKDQWLTIFMFFPIYFGSMFSGYFGDHAYLLLIPLLVSLSPVKIISNIYCRE